MKDRLVLVVLVLLLVFGFPGKTYSQCMLQNPPTLTCEGAPTLCLDGLCYHTNNMTFSCCTNWCGPNTIIQNPQYFQFIPSAPNVEIEIHVDDCTAGNGLQSAILDACPWTNSNVIACDPGVPPGSMMVLTANGLIPGEPHWIVIDGSGSAVCNYTFTSVEGVAGVEIQGDLGSLTANPSVLPKEPDTIHFEAASAVQNAQGYMWTFSWSTDTFITTDPFLDLFTPCLEEPGLLEVCVQAYNGCDTLSSPSCVTIDLLPAPVRIKATETFCESQFPFSWQGILIEGPGTYIKTFYVTHWPGQCPYDSVWTVEAYPVFAQGQIDTTVCSNAFEYEGTVYSQSGHYQISYPGQGVNGCDSIANLNLNISGIAAYVEVDCDTSSVTLNAQILYPPGSLGIEYQWFQTGIDSVLSTNASYLPDTSAAYTLKVFNLYCSDSISSYYRIDSCQSTCHILPSEACDGDTLWLPDLQEDSLYATYYRIIDSDGESVILEAKDTLYFIARAFNHYSVLITTQDTLTTHTCKEDIWVRPGPKVRICCDTLTCDTCTILLLSTDMTSGGATVTLSDGLTQWEIENVFLPTPVHVCPTPNTTTQFKIVDVRAQTTGCPGQILGDSSVMVEVQQPNATITKTGDTLCVYAQPDFTVQWTSCGQSLVLSTENCFQPETSGCYRAEVFSEAGCKDTSQYEFVLTSVEHLLHEVISLYPNPSTGIFYLVLPESIPLPVGYQIFDVLGRPRFHGTLNKNKVTLDTGSYCPTGVYYIVFEIHGYDRQVKKVTIL